MRLRRARLAGIIFIGNDRYVTSMRESSSTLCSMQRDSAPDDEGCCSILFICLLGGPALSEHVKEHSKRCAAVGRFFSGGLGPLWASP